jgi:hypothetical protein
VGVAPSAVARARVVAAMAMRRERGEIIGDLRDCELC